MKTILTLLFLVFTFTTSFAQSNSDSLGHLTFKGVPIDGTLDGYVSKMKKSGFTHVGTEDGVAMLRGDFAGYKNCIVGVSTLKQKDLVSKVAVIFPAMETWSSLSSDYYLLKELLTEKYGEPAESVEEFDTRSQPRNDNHRMHEVEFDNCKYHTTYETEKGSIELSIGHDGVLSCFVTLVYRDKINGNILRAKALGDL